MACDKDKAKEKRAAGQRTGSTRAYRAKRELVLRRDGFSCQASGCGFVETEAVALGGRSRLHVDHRQPLVSGGADVVENLETLCAAHNLAKGGRETSGRAPTPTPRPTKTYKCGRCGIAAVRLPGTRCPDCLPTALAMKPKKGR